MQGIEQLQSERNIAILCHVVSMNVEGDVVVGWLSGVADSPHGSHCISYTAR